MTKFGKYILHEKIASGGMAEIFRASFVGDMGFEKTCTIKKILPHLSEDESFVNMFIDEARLVSRLSHNNIVQVHDFGKIENSYYITMSYLDGKDLRKVVQRAEQLQGQIPHQLCAFLITEVLKGLNYAHEIIEKNKNLGIIHRDISPPNILISYQGEVKITDFGIAKAASNISLTVAGMLKGKSGYMSPEQARGDDLDSRSDLFAAGIVLWEMLTGQKLFKGDSDTQILKAVNEKSIIPPSSFNQEIPPQLETIVLKALERDLDNRYQTAGEMEDDLKNYLHKRDKIYDSKALSGYIKTLFSPDVESNVEKTKIFQPQSSPSTPAPAPVPIASLAHGSGEQNRLKGVSRKVKFAAVVLLLIIFICSLVLVKRYYSRQAPAPLAANSELQNRRSSKQESLANTTPDTAIAPLPAKGKPDLPAAENNRASGGLSPTRNSDIVKRTAVADSNVKSRDRSRVNLGVSQNIKKIKQRTRKSPAKSYGFVTIQTDPWTIIFINGKRRGITPIMELKLPIGRYTLVLENREKKIRKTKKITIVKGKTVIINENYLQQE